MKFKFPVLYVLLWLRGIIKWQIKKLKQKNVYEKKSVEEAEWEKWNDRNFQLLKCLFVYFFQMVLSLSQQHSHSIGCILFFILIYHSMYFERWYNSSIFYSNIYNGWEVVSFTSIYIWDINIFRDNIKMYIRWLVVFQSSFKGYVRNVGW